MTTAHILNICLIALIPQLNLLSVNVELVQLRGQANPCDRNYAIS